MDGERRPAGGREGDFGPAVRRHESGRPPPGVAGDTAVGRLRRALAGAGVRSFRPHESLPDGHFFRRSGRPFGRLGQSLSGSVPFGRTGKAFSGPEQVPSAGGSASLRRLRALRSGRLEAKLRVRVADAAGAGAAPGRGAGPRPAGRRHVRPVLDSAGDRGPAGPARGDVPDAAALRRGAVGGRGVSSFSATRSGDGAGRRASGRWASA